MITYFLRIVGEEYGEEKEGKGGKGGGYSYRLHDVMTRAIISC